MNDYELREEAVRMLNSADSLFDDLSSQIVADYTEFKYVDGEESDYGVIKYFMFGQLFATKTVHGGDLEDVEYTDFGKRVIQRTAIAALTSGN